MPKDEVRSTVLCVRIRPSLKRRLERLADRDRRTLSSWIELLLERTAKDGEKEKHPDLH
jgi:predicted transcriptional regulator